MRGAYVEINLQTNMESKILVTTNLPKYAVWDAEI